MVCVSLSVLRYFSFQDTQLTPLKPGHLFAITERLVELPFKMGTDTACFASKSIGTSSMNDLLGEFLPIKKVCRPLLPYSSYFDFAVAN